MIDVGNSPEVGLDSVAVGVAIVVASIWPHIEAESDVESERGVEFSARGGRCPATAWTSEGRDGLDSVPPSRAQSSVPLQRIPL